MGDASLEREALDFHSTGRPGKIEIVATKPMATQRDLALAYSPGVAAPVQAIAADPDAAYDYTASSEERRVGNEWASTCSNRRPPDHEKQNKQEHRSTTPQ